MRKKKSKEKSLRDLSKIFGDYAKYPLQIPNLDEIDRLATEKARLSNPEYFNSDGSSLGWLYMKGDKVMCTGFKEEEK